MSITEYNIYTYSRKHDKPFYNNQPVEMGLSYGELCQALIDRMKNDNNSNIMIKGWANNLNIDKKKVTIEEIEDKLYDLFDDELFLNNTSWTFTSEKIIIQSITYVEEDEE